MNNFMNSCQKIFFLSKWFSVVFRFSRIIFCANRPPGIQGRRCIDTTATNQLAHNFSSSFFVFFLLLFVFSFHVSEIHLFLVETEGVRIDIYLWRFYVVNYTSFSNIGTTIQCERLTHVKCKQDSVYFKSKSSHSHIFKSTQNKSTCTV